MSNKNRNQQQQRQPGSTKPAEATQAQQEQTQVTEQEQANAAIEGAADQAQDSQAPEAAAENTAAPVVQDTKPAEAPKAKAPVTQTQKGFKPVYKVELELVGYAEAMDKAKTVVPAEGAKWQYALYKAIKNTFLAKSQEDFNNEFNTILSFFNKNKDGIFNEKFIFRFPENWPGSQNEYTQNRRLVYLIIQSADPKNRKKSLESINMEMIAEGMTEPQKQMLFNFYQM